MAVRIPRQRPDTRGAGNITTTDNPATMPADAPAASGTQGLGGGVAHTAIHANNGAGSIGLNRTLTVNAPTSMGARTYNGTISLAIGWRVLRRGLEGDGYHART